MFRSWVTISAAAVFGLLGTASFSHAAPQVLMGVDSSGNTFSSGWTYDVSSADQVNLVYIRTDANGAFYFEKDAVITNNDSPLVISFSPIAGETQKQLVISDEAVTNQSGADWSGFRMILSATGTSTFGFGTTDGSTVGATGGFNIDPFTTASFTNGTSDLTLGGGTVAAGSTWFPGAGSSTGLTLDVTGASAFELKELALTGGTTGPGPVPIPLPASLWTGLSGLAGLALLGAAKKAKKHLV